MNKNEWRAARDGLNGELIDLERDEERPAREAVLALVDELSRLRSGSAAGRSWQRSNATVRTSTGADEQRSVSEEQKPPRRSAVARGADRRISGCNEFAMVAPANVRRAF